MHPFLQRKINRPQLHSRQIKQICLQSSGKGLQRNGGRANVSWQTRGPATVKLCMLSAALARATVSLDRSPVTVFYFRVQWQIETDL